MDNKLLDKKSGVLKNGTFLNFRSINCLLLMSEQEAVAKFISDGEYLSADLYETVNTLVLITFGLGRIFG